MNNNVKSKPEYIDRNELNFFFTDGYYIDGQLFVPWSEVQSTIKTAKTIELNKN